MARANQWWAFGGAFGVGYAIGASSAKGELEQQKRLTSAAQSEANQERQQRMQEARSHQTEVAELQRQLRDAQNEIAKGKNPGPA